MDGLRAVTIADHAADEALAYLGTNVPVGVHLADQLVLLPALAGSGSFRTLAPSRHPHTQSSVIERYPGRKAEASDEGNGA